MRHCSHTHTRDDAEVGADVGGLMHGKLCSSELPNSLPVATFNPFILTTNPPVPKEQQRPSFPVSLMKNVKHWAGRHVSTLLRSLLL